MSAHSSSNSASRKEILAVACQLLSDRKARTPAEMLRGLAMRGALTDPRTLKDVLANEGQGKVLWDERRLTYRLAEVSETKGMGKANGAGSGRGVGEVQIIEVLLPHAPEQAIQITPANSKPVPQGWNALPPAGPVIILGDGVVLGKTGEERGEFGGREERTEGREGMFAEPKFKLRDRVRVKADPKRKGRIVEEPRPYGGGYEYLVMLGEEEMWYSEAELEVLTRDGLPRWEGRDEYLRDLLLTKLGSSLTDSLYSYGASRTQFVPYQFRPALKFLQNPEQRILIADEVGLGKTIEAAIIYLELKARTNIGRVLVLCPSRLKGKWRDELRNRFEEEFAELDASGMRKLIHDYRRYGSIQFKAIASFETMRRTEFIEAMLEEQIPLDLLIVDEAHYMRNSGTQTYRLGSALTDRADAAVFLTATPLQLGNENLYNLMHLLAPGEFNNANLFEVQVQPNGYINLASIYLSKRDVRSALDALRKVETTQMRDRFLKNPYYNEVVGRLREGISTTKELVTVQRDLVELNTLAAMFTRTRKREVENAAVRAPYSIKVELSGAERAFYDGVLHHVRRQLGSARSGAPSFAVVMMERQAASCLAAARESFEEAAKKARASMLVEKSEFMVEATEEDPEVATTQELLQLSKLIGKADSKFDKFEEVLRGALGEGAEDSKALVFSFFRRTLDYLYRRLKALGYEVDVIHGGVAVEDRRRIIERFRTTPGMRVLLSSEVGAEGLDFQFCDILVNYDLPWNPMQIEQRIGRLDRFGQTHERIRIYNFFIEETIETRIFERLYERIGIFKSSVGDLEEILGEVVSELSQAALDPKVTEQELERKAEQAARRIVKYQLEAESLEKQKDSFLGQEEIFNQQVKDTISSGRMTSPDEVYAAVKTFLDVEFPGANFIRDDDEPTWTLRLIPPLAEHLRRYMVANQQQGGASPRFWTAMNNNGVVALTFSSEFARERPNLEFITARHPLAASATEYWREKSSVEVPAIKVEVEGPEEEVGEGYFYIYLMEVNGANKTRTLRPVVVMDDGRVAKETADTLLRQIQEMKSAKRELVGSEDEFTERQVAAARVMAKERDETREETERRSQAIIAAREASIRASFEAKIRRAESTLEAVSDERLVRMYRGQILNLRAQMNAKLAELKKGRDVSVSYRLISGGRIRVVAGAAPRKSTVEWEPKAIGSTGNGRDGIAEELERPVEVKEERKKGLLERLLMRKRARW